MTRSRCRSCGALALALALAACGGAPPVASHALSAAQQAQLTPALQPVAWWLGDWTADEGKSSEHWIAAGGAIYGVALHNETFEVLVIDDGDGPGPADGKLRLLTMLNGQKSTTFQPTDVHDGNASFTNEMAGFKRTVTYQRNPDGYIESFTGNGSTAGFQWRRGPAASAPGVEAADRAFSADTDKRGVDGWVAAFDADGSMMAGDKLVQHGEIGDAMQGLLGSGKLTWSPLASGQQGSLGYTVGLARFVPSSGPENTFQTSYVTIWRHQPDGNWKVLFDTGRVVNTAAPAAN